MADPLKTSIPRRPADFPRGVIFPSDSMHTPRSDGVPMRMPDPGIQVQPQPPGGYTSRPLDNIGATGAMPSGPTTGKVFGSPQDARQYFPEPGFSPPMDGPGTSPSNQYSFNPPQLGQSTTIKGPPGTNTPSGTGITSQGDTRISAVLSPAIPQEYHPQTGTVPNISGRKRYFR